MTERTRWLGRYEPRCLIGGGGYGRVWQARDRATGEDVAVKRIPYRGAADRRELAALRALQLPGVVRLVDDGIEGDEQILVTELVVGAPFPGGAPPCPWTTLRPRLVSVLRTLARVHRAGLLHLDLKPDNVLVGPDGEVTLLDFGLATHRTRSGADRIAGTPRYVPPEVLLGGSIGPASDLYMVGLMAIEALCGPEVIAADPLLRLSSRVELPPTADVPDTVRDLLARLTEPSPAARPAAAEVVLDALEGPPALGRIGPEPLDDALRRAFLPDRFGRADRDAAALVQELAAGDADTAARVLAGWVQHGIAEARGDRIRIDQDGYERAALTTWPVPRPPAPDDLPPPLATLLRRVDLLVPHATLERLAAWGGPGTAATVSALAARGLLARVGDGFVPRVAPPGAPTREDHRRAAELLPAGSAQRLLQAQLADDGPLAAAEAEAQGRRALAQGLPRRAFARFLEGLMALGVGVPGADPLVRGLVTAALEIGTPAAYRRALVEVERRGADPDLEALLEAGLAAARGEGSRALEVLAGRRFAPDLELLVLLVRVRAAVNVPAAFDQLAAAFDREEGASVPRSRLLNWGGLADYQRGRFARAGERHRLAHALGVHPGERMSAAVNAAAAAMEEGDLPEARRWAAIARDEALRVRHPEHAARAEVLSRAAAYRAGEPLAPDAGLVDELAQLGLPNLTGYGALTEAGFAWRHGDRPLAANLAARSRRAFAELDARAPHDLARALELVCTGPHPDDTLATATTAAEACPLPRVRAQILGLLLRAAAEPATRARLAHAAAATLAAIEGAPASRLEVLALDEVLPDR